MRAQSNLPQILNLLAVPVAVLWCVNTGPAVAKPKAVSNGCTAAQIQSPAAQPCIDKMEQDVLHGYTNVHALVCSGGKVQCCIVTQYGAGDCHDVRASIYGGGSLRAPTGGLKASP